MPRLRRFFALVAATAGCLSVGVYAAQAGVPSQIEPPTSTTSTPPASSTTSTTAPTTTTAPAGSTTSTTSTGSIGGITQVTSSSTTSTTQPEGSQGSVASSTTSSTEVPEGDGGSSGGPRVVPPGAQEVIDSIVRSKPNSTAKLLAALQPLIDMGMTPEQAYTIGMGRFPIAGLANFADDWYFPRWDGGFRFHKGTDIFAAQGTPVRSPADGVLRQDQDRLGGIVLYVVEPNGTYYYMAHLAGYVEGQVSGQTVKMGQIIAYNGNSGDARGGAYHVHLQVHPGGREPVDPKAYLDQWLEEALAAAPALVAQYRPTLAPATVRTSTGLRMPVNTAAAFAAPAVPARSQLLWASSANPQGGALQLAEAVATEAARSLDWKAEARRLQQRQLEWSLSKGMARDLTLPLVPSALRPLLDGAPSFVPGAGPGGGPSAGLGAGSR